MLRSELYKIYTQKKPTYKIQIIGICRFSIEFCTNDPTFSLLQPYYQGEHL